MQLLTFAKTIHIVRMALKKNILFIDTFSEFTWPVVSVDIAVFQVTILFIKAYFSRILYRVE